MRAVLAFIFTPLSFALLAAAAMPLAAWAAPSAEFTRVLGLFFYSPIVAYPIAICLGAPLYVLLRRFWRVTLGVCFAGGAVCGVVGVGLLNALNAVHDFPAYDLSHHLHDPLSLGPLAIVGGAYGFVFGFLLSGTESLTRRSSGPLRGR